MAECKGALFTHMKRGKNLMSAGYSWFLDPEDALGDCCFFLDVFEKYRQAFYKIPSSDMLFRVRIDAFERDPNGILGLTVFLMVLTVFFDGFDRMYGNTVIGQHVK